MADITIKSLTVECPVAGTVVIDFYDLYLYASVTDWEFDSEVEITTDFNCPCGKRHDLTLRSK
jgi:hypothetical protein